ncbi:MAG: hypothetical protein RH860_15160 [Cytophagales bacterium]|nr:hypothetical protein HZR84_08590 [Hyphobacterium sp. CCMP332]
MELNPKGTIFETSFKETKSGKKLMEKLVNPDGKGLEFNNVVSAARIDKDKVFWVIALDSDRPQHTGTSSSYQQAEKDVLKVLKDRRALCINGDFALQEYLEQEIEKQSGNSEFRETARVEYLYAKYGKAKFQIKKVLPKQLIIYSEPYKDGFTTDDNAPTFAVSKRELDDTGEVRAMGQIFCTAEKKYEFEKFRKIPGYLSVFGLDWDATMEDVKYWFRKLSLQHHPDRGGDVEKFRELTESYGKAVKALRDRDIRDGFL